MDPVFGWTDSGQGMEAPSERDLAREPSERRSHSASRTVMMTLKSNPPNKDRGARRIARSVSRLVLLIATPAMARRGCQWGEREKRYRSCWTRTKSL